ncbi:MAG: hypothetical protein V2I97_15215 [Desulfococcaceae bacterium]|jgi:hypothetical protein|nr:hypothetical protein [Desulfococcaceae bacterium]
MNPNTNMPPWAIRPITPEEVYTDRAEPLEYLYQYALKAITRRAMSTVLLGQRRMGKTEIFKRVVNRLFFGQKDYADLHNSVVPVYFCFEDKAADEWKFAEKYVENFLRWYTAFRLRDTDILMEQAVDRADLVSIIRDRLAVSKGLQGALNLFEALPGKNVIDPEGKALWMPRRVSDWDDSTVVMFLDEFQHTRLPQYNFDIVGLMQEAVESPTCPHFVTGSAMSILASEILGRGSLFGRFRSEPIGPLTEYWGTELARRSARYYRAGVPDDMTPVVSARCGGNPFYINAVIQQAAGQGKSLSDEEKINEILAVDLSSGFIWGELNDQVERWIHRINEQGITKWVLYLSALEEGEWIKPERIQQSLMEKEGKNVSVEDIRNVLIKLSRGDLLEYNELGKWFRKIDDPILLEFLKVWGRIAVEGYNPLKVQQDLILEYQNLKRRVHNHLGYLGEVYMSQILWNTQRQTLPGHFFHCSEDIVIPDRFIYIWHRTRLGAAADMEIDVEAAAGKEMWICESKWRKGKKVGVKEVESLLYKGELLQKKGGPGLRILRLWFFAHDGFTAEAEKYMAEKGVLWSDREDLDGLLSHAGLKRLPDV